MTEREMKEYAAEIRAGGKVVKAKLQKFMAALIDGHVDEPAPSEPPAPPTISAPVLATIKVTSTGGIHLAPDAARTYTPAEALALAAAIADAARSVG